LSVRQAQSNLRLLIDSIAAADGDEDRDDDRLDIDMNDADRSDDSGASAAKPKSKGRGAASPQGKSTLATAVQLFTPIKPMLWFVWSGRFVFFRVFSGRPISILSAWIGLDSHTPLPSAAQGVDPSQSMCVFLFCFVVLWG
jgi:hypothetical protein